MVKHLCRREAELEHRVVLHRNFNTCGKAVIMDASSGRDERAVSSLQSYHEAASGNKDSEGVEGAPPGSGLTNRAPTS
jgi:hypothetical protein